MAHQFGPDLNASDYVNADEDLPTRDTYDNSENWREELHEVLSGGQAKKQAVSESDSKMREMRNLRAQSPHSEKLLTGNILLKFLT